ncbi:MAG: CHAT domain-containing protein [Bacteroidia bacterium]|nr:CHAT domain-containing protein [Bacteroidia bacterium]
MAFFLRRILAGILFLGFCCWNGVYAEPLPWQFHDPDAKKAYLAIQPLMQAGQYAKAEALWKSAALRFSEHPTDQLIFVLGLGNQLRLRARFSESFLCYRACQQHFKELISQNPVAKAALLEGFADLAFEINQLSTRTKAIAVCKHAFASMPSDAPRRSTLARKIGVLCRLVKDQPSAKTWLQIAQDQDQGFAEEKALLQRDLAYQAFKDNDLDRAKDILDSARKAMEACPNLLQEEWICYYFYATELQYAIGSLTITSVEALENGEKACKAAIEIGEQYPEVVSNLLYVCYGRFAKIRAELGDYAGAIPFAEKSAEGQVARKISPRAISQAYSYLGEFNHYIGNFDQALNYYRQSWLSLLNTTDGADIYHTRLANYAQELINLQHYQDGEKYMTEAIDGLIAKQSDDDATLGRFYANLGIGYLGEKKFDAAIEAFENALERYAMANVMPWSSHCYALIYLATAQNAAGFAEAATANLNRSLVDLRQIPIVNRMERAMVLEMITDFHIDRGNFQEALNINHLFMQEMVGDAVRGINPWTCPDITHSVSPWHTLAAVSQKANILWGLYRQTNDLNLLNASLACSQKALRKLRRLRQEHNNEQEKLRINRYWQTLFENAMQAAIELHDVTHSPAHLATAFEIAEQSKAMLLMEAVIDNHVLETNGKSADLVDQRQRVQTRIMRLHEAINSATIPNRNVALLQAELFQAEKELDQIMQDIEHANPKYSDLVNSFDVISIAELQPLLQQENRTLIEYFYGDSAIYTFVVTGDTFVLHEFSPDSVFEAQLIAFTQALHQVPEEISKAKAGEFAAQSGKILDALWRPIENFLTPNVTIVPDGPLSFISFEALADSIPANGAIQFYSLGYLLERYTISYDYSGTFLSRKPEKSASSQNKVLAIAPSFSPEAGLQALPESMLGVQKLASKFTDVQTFVGSEGSKKAFLNHAPSHQILDLATHGRFDQKNFLNSCIYFSPDGTGDSILLLNELYTLNLPAELAILEACETGLGDYQQGEGVMSLARGFTYAGCKSVLMSLWEVAESKSTRAIMGDFFANLADSLPRDEAIAKAKRNFLQRLRQDRGYDIDQTHPFYWSELVMIGDNSPLPIAQQTSRGWNLIWIMGSASVLLFFATIWIVRQKRKQKSISGQ